MRDQGHVCEVLVQRLPTLEPGQRAALQGELEHIGEYLEFVGALIRRSVERGELDDALEFTRLAGEAVAADRLARI